MNRRLKRLKQLIIDTKSIIELNEDAIKRHTECFAYHSSLSAFKSILDELETE